MHLFITSVKNVLCGIPQGSTLGPLNFLIHIDDLKYAFEKPIIHYFADGTDLLYVSI